MIYDTIEPCKKKKGFEGIPKEFHNVPLGDLKSELLLNLKSFKLLRETRVILVLQDDEKGNKISIYPSCRVFVHGDIQKDEAKEIINEISKSIKKITLS